MGLVKYGSIKFLPPYGSGFSGGFTLDPYGTDTNSESLFFGQSGYNPIGGTQCRGCLGIGTSDFPSFPDKLNVRGGRTMLDGSDFYVQGGSVTVTTGTVIIGAGPVSLGGGISPASSILDVQGGSITVRGSGAGLSISAPSGTSSTFVAISTGSTPVFQITGSTTIINGIPRFSGNNTTGVGSTLLGTNSPASSVSAPYTWIEVRSADGSVVYIPAWK